MFNEIHRKNFNLPVHRLQALNYVLQAIEGVTEEQQTIWDK